MRKAEKQRVRSWEAAKVKMETKYEQISDHQQSWGYEAGPSKGPGPRSAGGR
jgi:hypothetical protein